MLKRSLVAVRQSNWKLYLAVYTGFTLLFFFVSMVVNPLFVKHHMWMYSMDFFAEMRDAHLITWGGYQLLYSSGTGLVVPPLGPLSLTPLAALSSMLGLVEPFPYPLVNPSVMFIAIPYFALFATLFFYAARRFTARFGTTKSLMLELIATTVASFTLMPWGHIEDVAAMAFVLLGFVSLSKANYRSSSYLFGVAIAFQPFALLFVVPSILILVRSGRESVIALLRAAIPTFVVYFPLLITSPTSTLHTLMHQNNYPSVDHLTVVGLSIEGRSKVIAAGPPRLLLVLLTVGISLCIRYARRPSIRSYGEVFLIVSLISAARIFFEPVMVPYYIVPTLAYLILSGIFFDSQLKIRSLAMLFASAIILYLASTKMSALSYSACLYVGTLLVSSSTSLWFIRYSLESEVLRRAIEPYHFGADRDLEDEVSHYERRSRFGVVKDEAAINLDAVPPRGIGGGADN